MTPERLILLDAQPVQSPSVLAELLQSDTPSSNTSSHLTQFEHQSVQLVLFLLSVCHVVIVASDWVSQNLSLWKLLRSATLLMPIVFSKSLLRPDPHTPDATVDVVFLANKVKKSEMNSQSWSQLTYSLEQMFRSTPIRHRGMFDGDGSTADSINLFCLPYVEEQDDKKGSRTIDRTNTSGLYGSIMDLGCDRALELEESFDRRLKQLRNRVLLFPKLAARKRLTERDWLTCACSIWNDIEGSHSIQEYKKVLHNSLLS